MKFDIHENIAVLQRFINENPIWRFVYFQKS